MYNQGSTKLYNVLMGNPSGNAVNNAIGRYAGQSFSTPQQSGNLFENAITGFGDNIKNRARAIGNTMGTTFSAPVSAINDIRTNVDRDNMMGNNKARMDAVAKKYGYNSYQDVWDARDAAEAAGDTATLNKINNVINPELQAQATENSNKINDFAADYNDYRKNDYISQKINQDRGKYLGDSLTTLSTAADIAAMTTGMPMGLLANTVQGGVEGIANELSQNGLENFDWGRAGQNALIGAASGAATAGLNKVLPAAKQGGLLRNVASSTGRGALSGTVGGAVGGGLGAAMNNQDVLQGAVSGATQGAVSGGVSGAAMGTVNALGNKIIGKGLERAQTRQLAGEDATLGDKAFNKIAEIQNTGKNWAESGENFNERLTNTLNSGESAVGNWLNNKTQSKVLNTAGNLGNKIQFDENGDLVLYRGQKGVDDLYYNSDQEKGTANLEGAYFMTPDEEQAALFGDDVVKLKLSPEQQEKFFLTKEQYAKLVDDASRQVSDYDYMDKLYQTDPELAERIETTALGRPNDIARFTNKPIMQNDASDIDEMFVYKGINPEFDELIKTQLSQPTTASGWLKKAGSRIVEDLNNKGVGLSVKNVENAVDTTNTQGVDAWDRIAQQQGYDNYNQVIQRYLEANPDVELNPRGAAGQILTWLDENPNTPTTLGGWVKRAGERVVEDLNNKGAGLSVKNVNDEIPEDIQNMQVRDYNADSNGGLTERIKNNLRSPNSRLGNRLKNMSGRKGDIYNDWLAEPAQIEEFGPRYSQFSGNAEAARDYLMRRQQGEVPRASYNQSLEDLNGDGFIDYAYGAPGEGSEYSGGRALSHIQAKHGDGALGRVPYNTENGTPRQILGDRVILENDANNDTTVIRTNWNDNKNGKTIKKQWLATNFDPNEPVSRGATNRNSSTTGTALGSDTEDTPIKSIVPQNDENVNNPQLQAYKALTGDNTMATTTAKTMNKTSFENASDREAGFKLAQQYGTIDKKTANATNASETFAKISKQGFTKPADVERIANAVTGADGEVSKLVQNLVQNAKPVNTFDGETASQTLDDFIDKSINNHGLSAQREGKSVRDQLKSRFSSLPSHTEGSLTATDDAVSVFKLIQGLEADAAEWRGKSGNNYATTTQDKTRAAGVVDDVVGLLKDRLFNSVDVKDVLTPEVAANLKAYAPNNKEWANAVDNELMSATSIKDLRKFQAPYVRAKKIIDNGSMNVLTYGGKMTNGFGIPLTKKGLIAAFAGATLNSNPGLRTQAKALQAASKVAGKIKGANATPTAATPTQPNTNNTQTQVYDLLNRNNTLNIIGREAGLEAGGANKPAGEYIAQASAEQGYVAPLGVSTTTAPTTLENLTSTNTASTTTPTTLASALGNSQSTTSNTAASATTPNYTYTDIIAGAMERAAAAGDADAFATLYGMYNDAAAELQSQNNNSSNLSATQQTQLAKFDSAEDAINELEDLYNQAGGGKGAVLGWLQERGADLTLDSNARTYRQMAEGLVNQVAQAIGKTDSLNTEGEVKRALQLVPSLTDDAQTAQNKLKTLRQMLEQTRANYYNAYGVAY